MKNKKLVFIMASAVILPICFEFSSLENQLGSSGLIYNIFWMLINYLFISACVEIITSYGKVFKLPGLKTNKPTYWVNILMYLGFLIFVNIYFIQQMYIRDNLLINRLAHPYVVLMILFIFLTNLYCGIFPQKEEQRETRIFTLSEKGSFKYGREKFGTVVGKYDGGIVLGPEYFPFETIRSVSSQRTKSQLVIKGKDSKGLYRVNISAPKSTERAREIFLEAAKAEKIDENKINIH